MNKHVLFTGKLLPTMHSENLCRTQIKVKINEDLSYLLENPAGNHIVVTRNNYKRLIERFLQIV